MTASCQAGASTLVSFRDPTVDFGELTRKGSETMKLRMDDLTWQEIDGELVILDLQGSVYLTTNAAGAFLTKLLTEERSEGELTDALMTEYQIDRETAERDVDAFVAQLTEQNLLA